MKRLMAMLCAVLMFQTAFQVRAQESTTEHAPVVLEAVVLSDNVFPDLSRLSDTMAYAELYRILNEQQEYLGKTIRMRGTYFPIYVETLNMTLHYIVINDAAACCQMGLEFLWTGEHKYPDDYPPEGSSLELTGLFDQIEMDGVHYACLKVNEVVTLPDEPELTSP